MATLIPKYDQGATGASNRPINEKFAEFVSVKDFGAKGDGTTDDTSAVQAAINAASNNNISKIYIPSGVYKVSAIYLTYDAALNPDFSSTYIGRIELYGDKPLSENDAINFGSKTTAKASVLKGSSATLSTLILSTTSQGTAVSTYPVRGQVIKNLSVVSNTTGYCIENNGAPEQSVLEDVTVVQQNAAGHGILWKSSWYSNLNRVLCTTASGVTSTGNGLTIGATTFAGIYTIANSYFKHFNVGAYITSTLSSTEINFSDCSFEANQNYGVYVDQAAKNIDITKCYFENNLTNHIRVEVPATNYITNLGISKCFMLGGTTSAAVTTGPQIYLKTAQACTIDSVHFMRPWTNLIYNYYDSVALAGRATTVKNCTVDFAGVSYGATTVNCIDTNSQSGVPLLTSNELPSNAVFTPVNATYYSPNIVNPKDLSIFGFNFSAVVATALNSSSTTVTLGTNSAPMQIYTTTATGCAIEPPSGLTTARTFFIANASASTQSLTLNKVGAGTLTTLAAGEAAIWFNNPNTSEFVAMKTTFVS